MELFLLKILLFEYGFEFDINIFYILYHDGVHAFWINEELHMLGRGYIRLLREVLNLLITS